MEQNDKIKDLFSEKLGNFESTVRPELWSNIASQIGATTTVATVSTGVSLFTKTIIGISVAATIGGIGYFAWNKEDQETDKNGAEVTVEKKGTKGTDILHSSTTSKRIVQRKMKGNITIDNSLFIPAGTVGDFIVPTPEDVLALVVDSKDLPTTVVQASESTNIQSTAEDKKQEQQIDSPLGINGSEENASPSKTSSESVQDALELPNVFTPNNDGLNDYLEIKASGLTDFSLVVLDMNGKPVFQTNDPTFKWDGTNLANERVNDGNYLYYLTARNAEGVLLTKSQILSIKTQR